MTDAADAPRISREQTRAALHRLASLALPYFKSEQKYVAWGLLAASIGANLAIIVLNVLFNDWYRRLFDSLDRKDTEAFVREIGYWAALAAAQVLCTVHALWFQQKLEMRWRAWLTDRLVTAWLADRLYYRLKLQPDLGVDSIEQRFTEDMRVFCQEALALAVGLFGALGQLLAFIGVLWALSPDVLPAFLGGSHVPGALVWPALLYAGVGAWLAHAIGQRLVRLGVRHQGIEGDFRLFLTRTNENAESVAVNRGEPGERRHMEGRFVRLIANWRLMVAARRRLTFVTSGYAQLASIFPYLVISPLYFAGQLTLGQLMQTVGAFTSVQQALSWFVDSYPRIAEFMARAERVATLQETLDAARAEVAASPGIVVEEGEAGVIVAKDLQLDLPTGDTLLKDVNLELRRGEHTVLVGPSGVGKSTLFRAVAGIWPFGSGLVRRNTGERVLFLPQNPYLPHNSLRAATLYPEPESTATDEEIRQALHDVGLDHLRDRLDEEAAWGQRLSDGERQRVAVARALILKPDWLFLDEATTSLDIAGQTHIYKLLEERLAETGLVSVADEHLPFAREARVIHVSAPIDADGDTRLSG